MGIENHKVKIIRIGKIERVPNADTIGITMVGGYQVVVKLSDFKEGDLALYIQPNTVVPEAPQFAFLWADVPETKEVPLRKRRITVRKFRKAISEGLMMPITEFKDELMTFDSPLHFGTPVATVHEGDDVAEKLGFTHWDDYEDEPVLRTPKRKRPKTLRGWIMYGFWSFINLFRSDPRKSGENRPAPEIAPPTYNVEAYKNFVGAFTTEDIVVVTEKFTAQMPDSYGMEGECMQGQENYGRLPIPITFGEPVSNIIIGLNCGASHTRTTPSMEKSSQHKEASTTTTGVVPLVCLYLTSENLMETGFPMTKLGEILEINCNGCRFFIKVLLMKPNSRDWLKDDLLLQVPITSARVLLLNWQSKTQPESSEV